MRPAGAALSLIDLLKFRDWLDDGPRDLELQDFVFASVLGGDWRSFADIARRQLEGYEGRLGIHGPFSGFEIDARDPDVREVVARRLDQALDVCDAIGARLMVIHSPFRAWDAANMPLKRRGWEERVEAVHRAIGAAVKRAEALGIRLAIENIQDNDPALRVRLAESFASPAVGVSVDTGHALWCHHQTGAPPVDEFIRIAGKHLFHVHFQDADGWADRHWKLGDGILRWPPILRAIAETGADPHLILELHDPAGIRASAELLDRMRA
ncbi:MAG: sugar phosphate isomerase/epimerase [Alphaproteobacteria bacterium]|nr:MAG: sugar phosphate isomerase/epimerase [Alphaproteobacteria bacterium]